MITIELLVLLLSLFLIAALYSSVGLGGASGYLAVLSMASLAENESIWFKQYAWCLNLVVAGLAFWQYRRSGHHDVSLSAPFVATSVPMAAIGGYLLVGGDLYDVLLSIALIFAAWRLLSGSRKSQEISFLSIPRASLIGGIIGFGSGIIGTGGGIFLLPALILGGWATEKQAAATTSLFVWLNSLAGLIGVGLAGRLDLDHGLLFSFIIAVLLGGIIGSRYGSQVSSQDGIRMILAIVLLLAAAKRVLEVIA
ncbi:MAG: hypothetical protein CMA28_03725 [Euryarchaeota archaeon]|nr:hypothetical protein [Euryarchaeota archaeon]